MITAIIILAATNWALCVVLGYVLVRSYWRRELGHWLAGDRRIALVLALLGPAVLLAMVLTWLSERCSDNGNKPAGW